MWLPLLSWRRDPMDEVSHIDDISVSLLSTKTYKGCCLYKKYNIITNAIKQIRFVDSVVIYKHFCIYTCSSWCLQIQDPKDQFLNGTSYQFCFGVLSLPYVFSRNLGGVDVKHHQDPCEPSQLSHVIRNRSSTTSKWWTAKDLKYMFEHIVKHRSMKNLYLPPRKWSWNLKKTPWKGTTSTNQHFSVSMWNFGGVILGIYSIHVW